MLIGTLQTVQHNFLDHRFTYIDLNYDEKCKLEWIINDHVPDMIMFGVDEVPEIIIPKLIFDCKKIVKLVCFVHDYKYKFDPECYGLIKIDERDGYFMGIFK